MKIVAKMSLEFGAVPVLLSMPGKGVVRSNGAVHKPVADLVGEEIEAY